MSAAENLQKIEIPSSYLSRGFLPQQDPATHFPYDSELSMLDDIGRDLPSMLEDRRFRDYAKSLNIPMWPKDWDVTTHRSLLNLYYLRLGFLASAYVNQTCVDRATLLPTNIAAPLVQAGKLLKRPPILSYDGYALYNWKRFDSKKPIALGNIDTIQNFVHLYDEHWFILVHVEIEANAAKIISAIADVFDTLAINDSDTLNCALQSIADSVWQQVKVLRRIPEKMDPALYFKTFRPYIRYFKDVVYKGIDIKPIDQRGETGAQSSIMPMLVAFMKIPHQETTLTNHLLDMRNYMPYEHRVFIEQLELMPAFKDRADKEPFNNILDAMATFREVHYHWANEYINLPSKDQTGTGGTPYMLWLKQLIDETRSYKF